MILIAPDGDRQYEHGRGAGAAGLLASIRCAVSSETTFNTERLCFRTLGNMVVIEGVLPDTDAAQIIRRIANEIAGEEHVIVRVTCINPFASSETLKSIPHAPVTQSITKGSVMERTAPRQGRGTGSP